MHHRQLETEGQFIAAILLQAEHLRFEIAGDLTVRIERIADEMVQAAVRGEGTTGRPAADILDEARAADSRRLSPEARAVAEQASWLAQWAPHGPVYEVARAALELIQPQSQAERCRLWDRFDDAVHAVRAVILAPMLAGEILRRGRSGPDSAVVGLQAPLQATGR